MPLILLKQTIIRPHVDFYNAWLVTLKNIKCKVKIQSFDHLKTESSRNNGMVAAQAVVPDEAEQIKVSTCNFYVLFFISLKRL